MKLTGAMVLWVLLTGCSTTRGTGGSGSSPPPGVQPTTKKELPWLNVPGGRMKTTLFCGPWQCRREFMQQCQKECAQEAPPLMGCMWLADIKLDWEGSLVLLPVPVKAGSRYALYHCCCDYTPSKPAQTAALREQWDSFRNSFRRDWSKRFGDWPVEKGRHWPGHHIRDLGHGGKPVDPNNILPVPPSVHGLLNEQYPVCYAGGAPWNQVGPDLPYSDQ